MKKGTGRAESGTRCRIEYRVLERPSWRVLATCDTLRQAREAVRILENYDAHNGTYEPLTYDIQCRICEEGTA